MTEYVDLHIDDDGNYEVHGMEKLMFCEFLICLVSVLFAIVRFRDAPPTPPSQSTQLKLEHREVKDHISLNAKSLQTLDAAEVASTSSGGPGVIGRESLMSESGFTTKYSADFDYRITMSDKQSFSLPPFLSGPNPSSMQNTSQPPPVPISTMSIPRSSISKQEFSAEEESNCDMIQRELKELFSNPDYVILFFIFSVVVGFFNSMMTLLNQLISPFGYSNADASTCSIVFIVTGVIGASINGAIMKKTKAYRTLFRIAMWGCALSTLFFVCMLFSNNYWPLMTSMALIGKKHES